MSSIGEDDPFKDPSLPSLAGDSTTQLDATNVPPTLAVGRSASLTLGTDSLIVLDEELRDSKGVQCCGIALAGKNKTTRSIPFYNVLWAETSEAGEIVIHYAHAVSKKVVQPAIISYKLDKPDSNLTEGWIESLLGRAYGASQRQKRIKVLVNPFGGQGGAQKMYHKYIAPIFSAAKCHLDMEKTGYRGHGVDIARNLDIEAYDVVACCSGDGIPHEVWNGMAQRGDAARALVKIALAQLPCGSGNAMSLNFNGTVSPSLAALAVVKGLRTPLDLVSVTQGDQRTLSFLSQAVGLVADCDLGTEHLRWMGAARFTYGALLRILTKAIYPADIAVKVEHADKNAIRNMYQIESAKPPRSDDDRELPSAGIGLPPLQYGTINDPLPSSMELIPHDKLGTFYAGNLAYMSPDANFFPASLPSDGYLDLVRIRGDLKRFTGFKVLVSVENHKFFDKPEVDYQKISAFRFIPKNQKDGNISIDGESVPFQPFQAEVHKGLGTVLSKSGHLFEARGV